MAAYLRRSVHRSAFYGICYVLPQENCTVRKFLYTKCNFCCKICNSLRCAGANGWPAHKEKILHLLTALPLRLKANVIRYAARSVRFIALHSLH